MAVVVLSSGSIQQSNGNRAIKEINNETAAPKLRKKRQHHGSPLDKNTLLQTVAAEVRYYACSCSDTFASKSSSPSGSTRMLRSLKRESSCSIT